MADTRITPAPAEPPTPLDQLGVRLRPVLAFVRTELFGSMLLVAATAVALIWANGPWAAGYFGFVHGKLSVAFEGHAFSHTVQEWVNDGLMTLFFFLIGLEIKRELVVGRLRDRRAAVLPAVAALGGMVVPAGVFLAFNAGGPASHGWAVPMATDIAFALGVLGILGRRVPVELRLFLLTLAILDDIGGILVIAVFYSRGIAFGWLAGLAAIPFLIWLMRWLGVRRVWLYVPPAFLAWVCALKSGVHPTIAGVIVGLMTPAVPLGGRRVLEDVEHALHPWVSFLVVPVFALVNAGVSLDWSNLSDALNRRVTWGIFAGLVVGKTVGVIACTWLGLRLGLGRLPTGVRFAHIVGMAPLAGIGFTVALVIGSLSFVDPGRLDAAKIGILGGSLVAAVAGGLALAAVARGDRRPGA